MAKIKFTTINVDGVEVTREFETIKDLTKEYFSDECDLPANDDEVVYAEFNEKQLHYPQTFEELIEELGIKNTSFTYCVHWMTTNHGGNGVHYSYADTVKEAIEECKQEHMYNRYTGKIIRPDLKITDIWKFVQYGE